MSSTSPAPSLRFRPARPQSLCARVPGSTRPLAGTTSRVRAPTHVESIRPPAHCKTPRKGLFLVHPRRAGARPRSARRPIRASRLLVTSRYPFSATSYSVPPAAAPGWNAHAQGCVPSGRLPSAPEHLRLCCGGFVPLFPGFGYRSGPTISDPVTPQS